MIIASTPLRISFFGGGSDLPAFIAKDIGASLAVTINKYVHVIIKKTHNGLRFIHEDISNIDNMRNPIASEIFKDRDITTGLDVISLSDVPCVGSGLGGSSAFAISLYRGLQYLNNERFSDSDSDIAKKICEIEIDKCGYPIGIQDQSIIAFGGMRLLQYHGNPREAIRVSSVNLNSDIVSKLENNLVLIYSGIKRDGSAGTILQKQQNEMNNSSQKYELTLKIRDRAYKALEYINNGKLNDFGNMLHEAWLDKRQLSSSLTSDIFNEMYDYGYKNGALGGKLLGAGGGGFFLFYTENAPEFIAKFTTKFPISKIFPFKFVNHSTKFTVI